MGRNMLKTADFRGFLGVFLFVFIGFSRFLGCRHGRFTVGVDRELASEVRNETASLAAQYLATCRRYFEPLRADFEPFLIIFPRVFHVFFHVFGRDLRAPQGVRGPRGREVEGTSVHIKAWAA